MAEDNGATPGAQPAAEPVATPAPAPAATPQAPTPPVERPATPPTSQDGDTVPVSKTELEQLRKDAARSATAQRERDAATRALERERRKGDRKSTRLNSS